MALLWLLLSLPCRSQQTTATREQTLASGVGRAPCAESSDCNGGVCDSAGQCRCPVLWEGAACEKLRLAPADPHGSGLRLPATTTWGGGIVPDPQIDGSWHMYAARLVGGCGLKSWTTNSEIVHAVSKHGVTGPYQLAPTGPVVYPTFAHNPTVARLTNSTYLLGYIGCGGGTKVPVGVLVILFCAFDLKAQPAFYATLRSEVAVPMALLATLVGAGLLRQQVKRVGSLRSRLVM
eukprot:SAG31_NODE_12378_length_946_cov_1.010626_1_plen_235_part_00